VIDEAPPQLVEVAHRDRQPDLLTSHMTAVPGNAPDQPAFRARSGWRPDRSRAISTAIGSGSAKMASRMPPERPLPGTTRPQRFRPRFHYELLACGLSGHELIGLDAETLRPEDRAVAREGPDGQRWYRCLRCDSWLPLPAPERPARAVPPAREEVVVPLRGRALRDKIVLRVIAFDRAVHFVILAAIAVAIFVFAANRLELRSTAFRVLADLQGGVEGSAQDSGHGLFHEVRHLFSLESGTLTRLGLIVSAYAIVEGAEAVGLWYQRRWAEYLTFVATAALLPLEVYEIVTKLSPLKIITFVLNVAVVVYLLLAKRLFGLRGGARAEAEERERDAGWAAIDRATPGAVPS
jgi:uncharacterized membrane protein (DUF2068 family)